MMIEHEPKFGALEKARQMSQALSEAARRARFSTRRRGGYASGGFQARRGARAMQLFFWISFVLIVALPSVTAALYFGFFASDQYEAEAQFTVMGGLPPTPDGLASLTGLPAMAVVQDTQIVTNFIESRAAVEKLEAAVHLRELYSRPDIDGWARFDRKNPVEKLVRYWRNMTSASIGMPAGIVTFKVRAFSAVDARKIGDSVISISEDLINELNSRMNADAVKSADDELGRTSARLAAAQAALEKARNEEGVLDTGKSGEALTKLITDLRGQVARLQGTYNAELNEVSASAPQMATLKARIDAARVQIADLESKLTSAQGTDGAQRNLSSAMARFAELDLEQQISLRLYAGAAASLELAKMIAEHKLMYLNTFVRPVEPEEPRYPRRSLDSFFVLAGSLACWGALFGVVSFARNHIA